MKIAVIGASGKLGQILVEDLLRKENIEVELTALVRDKNKISQNITVIETDILDITSKEIQKYDIVISAYGADAGKENSLIDTTRHLIHIFANNTTTRLIICGGVGPLFVDSNKDTRVSDSALVPDFVVALAKAETSAFQLLEEEQSFDWVYFAPPLALSYEDTSKTGEYIRAGEVMPTSSEGNMSLSYPNYSIAILDEISSENHISHQIISVVGIE